MIFKSHPFDENCPSHFELPLRDIKEKYYLHAMVEHKDEL